MSSMLDGDTMKGGPNDQEKSETDGSKEEVFVREVKRLKKMRMQHVQHEPSRKERKHPLRRTHSLTKRTEENKVDILDQLATASLGAPAIGRNIRVNAKISIMAGTRRNSGKLMEIEVSMLG